MSTSLDPLGIRARLGRDQWGPAHEHGPDGWLYDTTRRAPQTRIIVTCSDLRDDSRQWVHASISHADQLPTYEELQALHRAVWPTGWAYQVFAPPSAHINIHPHVLHLWGLLSGERPLPNFGWAGTI